MSSAARALGRLARLLPALLAAAAALGAANALLLAWMGAGWPDPASVALCLAWLLAAELVRSLRLLALAGLPPSPRLVARALAARLASNAVALVTPSSMGGEAAKALVLGGLRPRLLAASLYDSVADLWACTAVAVAALPARPGELAAALAAAGLAASLAWAVGVAAAPALLRRLAGWEPPRLGAREAAASVAAGVASLALAAQGLAPVSEGDPLPALAYAMLAGLAPTPGGVLAVDAALALQAGPGAAAVWRASAYALGALGAAPLLTAALRRRG